MMRLPLIEPENDRAVDMRQVERMVDAFIEWGFTYFDTAYMYHDFTSECVARKALVKRHARDSFTLASKLPTMFLKKEDDQERIFGEQLVKCGVDYFDYYLLHSLNGTNYATAERLPLSPARRPRAAFATSAFRSTTGPNCWTRS